MGNSSKKCRNIKKLEVTWKTALPTAFLKVAKVENYLADE